MSNTSLHILNGQCLYDYLETNNLFKEGIYIPFNEAMCVGKVTDLPFTSSFIAKSPRVHHITASDYEAITLNPLAPLLQTDLNKHFDEIHLYFDHDMFCQMNLLTLLAYLDTMHFTGKVNFHLIYTDFINKDLQTIQIYPLSCSGYADIYKKVFMKKEIPSAPLMPVLQKGIRLYLNTFDDDWEVLTFIKEHKNLSDRKLAALLLQTFTAYGLGDVQYLDLINKVRLN